MVKILHGPRNPERFWDKVIMILQKGPVFLTENAAPALAFEAGVSGARREPYMTQGDIILGQKEASLDAQRRGGIPAPDPEVDEEDPDGRRRHRRGSRDLDLLRGLTLGGVGPLPGLTFKA